MKYLTVILALMVGPSTYAQAPIPSPQYHEGVARVIDGDTFVIAASWNPYPNLEWKVRVLGIDTPEKGALAKCKREQDLSKKAVAYAQELIKASGGKVILTNVQHDKYGGRLDATVTLLDGRDLGKELIAAGLARAYNGAGPKPNWCRP